MTVDVVAFGKHVEVPPELRDHAVAKLQRVEKFAADVRRVDVDFSVPPNRRSAASRCEILVHLKKHLVKGCANAGDQRTALDLAYERVEHQLRRLHERRTSRRPSRRNGARPAAASNGVGTGEHLLDETVADTDATARIVKTKQFEVKPMQTEEAALQMELLGHDFFLFTSTDSGRAAVIYRRRDGSLGMIEATG
jgi:putative sigma-54 modulation protein